MQKVVQKDFQVKFFCVARHLKFMLQNIKQPYVVTLPDKKVYAKFLVIVQITLILDIFRKLL